MYKLYAGDVRAKAKLVQAIIALANTAAIYHHYAYLLLGIGNDGNITGLVNELTPFGLTLPFTGEIPNNVKEDVRSKLKEIILTYISPVPKWSIHFGVAPDKAEGEDVPVAQLCIEPHVGKAPYHAIKPVGNLVKRGECLWRYGESSHHIDFPQLSEGEWRELIKIPHISPSEWQNYFERLLREPILREAYEIKPLIKLNITTGDPLQGVFDAFLDDPDWQLLVLEGVAGGGKSIFAKRAVFELAEKGKKNMEEVRRRRVFLPPPGWTPIYFPLMQRHIHSVENFTTQLLDELNGVAKFWGSDRPEKPEALFEWQKEKPSQNMKWIVFLDGLDELLNEDEQRTFLEVMRHSLNRFPHLKLALFSRPFVVRNSWREWPRTKAFSLSELTEQQVRKHIEDKILASDIPEKYIDSLADEIENFFRSHNDLWRLCSTPYYLEAAIQSLSLGNISLPDDAIPEINLDTSVKSIPETEIVEKQESAAEAKAITADELILESPIDSEEIQKEPELQDEDDVLIPLRLSDILERIYQSLWTREAKRHRISPDQNEEWQEQTSRFASKRCGKPPRFLRKTALQMLTAKKLFLWLLSVGILKANTHGTYSFYTELTRIYFTAKWIIRLHLVGREKEARKLITKCNHPELQSFVQSELTSSGGY